MKVKKITLTSGWDAIKKSPAYRVEQVENSVTYKPLDFLEEREVKDLCASTNWRVVIKAKA